MASRYSDEFKRDAVSIATTSGLTRPISQTQRDDMVLLAQIREQHRLSLQSYGRPRMTEELQELGLTVGHRRGGRLMGENGIKVVRTPKH